MKLNKVLALALSGVMAVSMLAGCSGNPGNGGQGGEQSPVVTTDAAEVLNKIQSAVKFDDDATLNGYMAPVETLKPSVVEKLSDNDSVTLLATSNDAVKAIMAKMVKEDADTVKANFDAFNKNGASASNKDDVTNTVFYAVNADKVISIEHLMTELSSQLTTNKFKTKVNIKTGADAGNYVASYTGAVSVKKATGTDEDGKTYNAYVVAVSITRTLGDKLVG